MKRYGIETTTDCCNGGEETNLLDPLMDAPLRTGSSDSRPDPVPATAMPGPSEAPVVGALVGIVDGEALVAFPGQPDDVAVRARSTVELTEEHVGRQALLLFERGDRASPIVVGILRVAGPTVVAPQASDVQIFADDRRVVVAAKDQLVLRCGNSSITLTKDGKVLIQGAYVSSRSSGVNRIKGGSVQIN